MSRSSHLQQQQPRQRLLDEALSHGPYLWSDRDVQNALLWFRSLCGGDNRNNNASTTEENAILSKGRQFLRCLLQARGICMHRPMPDRSQRPSNNKKRKKSSASADDVNSGKSRRRGSNKRHREKGERRRPQTAVDGGGDGTSDLKRLTDSTSPLQSIILGYYQLYLPLQSLNDSSKGNDENDDDRDDGHFTESHIHSSEMASANLLGDLTSIVSARSHTSELYRAYTIFLDEHCNGNTQREMTHSRILRGMSHTIDEYMTHPTTCSRRVYASSLFDRLLDLGRRTPEAIATTDRRVGEIGNHDDGGYTNNPALRKFLQKLFGLASENVKIREVVLLLLVEPMRRLQQQASEEPRGTDLAPLLTSAPFWATIPSATVERVCSCTPLPTLIHFILQTFPKKKPLPIGLDGALAHSTMPTAALAGGYNPTGTICWSTLPSPLLCTISQWHFPIASEYIRFWIDRAMIGHDKLHNDTPKKQERRINAICTSNVHVEESLFEHATLRIKQFCSTSERLHLLGSHTLHSMERESREESDTSALVSEEEENLAFSRELTWKAIRRAALS